MKQPVRTPPKATAPASDNSRRWIHRIVMAVFFAAICLVSIRPWRGQPYGISDSWMRVVLLVSASAATLSSLSGELPGQNVFLAAVLTAAIGGTASAIGTLTGAPFGPYIYTEAAGLRLFSILPWSVPLIWIVMVLSSRGAARLILQPWRNRPRPGARALGLTIALAIVFDVGLEVFASRIERLWLWRKTRVHLDWFGIAPTHFPGLAAVLFFLLLLVTPGLINKKPATVPVNRGTAAVWVTANLLFASDAAARQLWPVVGLILATTLAVVILAVRGARAA